MWWKRRLELRGSVYFQGSLVPTLESLEGLAADGLVVEPLPGSERDVWAARLRHPSWGEASVHAQRKPLPLPSALIDFAPLLSDADRDAARRAGACLLVSATPAEGHVLRDRKSFLRFLSAILGRDGVVAVDVISSQLWTRARLDEELAHDAPLDIDQIYVLHCVGDEGNDPTWVHSHGLSEVGFVDFDVLRPSKSVLREQFELFRALAFAIVEGKADAAIELASGASVALVPVDEFTKHGSAADVGLRDDTDEHSRSRVVVCDPASETRNFFQKLFGSTGPRIAGLFRKGIDPQSQVIAFSTSATELMAERARGTIGLFDTMRQEFAFLDPKPVVKLGYAIDGAGDADDREHLWFEVHGIDGDRVDATLLNQPFSIARMQRGTRDSYDLSLLSDWSIFTPVGAITPRNLTMARTIRERRADLERLMASLPAS